MKSQTGVVRWSLIIAAFVAINAAVATAMVHKSVAPATPLYGCADGTDHCHCDSPDVNPGAQCVPDGYFAACNLQVDCDGIK